MKFLYRYSFLIILFAITISCAQNAVSSFVIADKNDVSIIYIDENADDLIKWAVEEFAKDIEEITGLKPKIKTSTKIDSKDGIYIGQFKDGLLKSVIKPIDSLEGAWEKFVIKKQSEKLVVIGSDVRGTVYGVFEIAERLGISPWKWWADVHPIKQEKLVLEIPKNKIIASPSVQYRGIFLNDEDWGLQPWAAKTFETETNDIGPKTYEKIFQLLLRLKANTIWPAMHPSTKAFYSIDGNQEMAQKYQIAIGSSHAEPMLRNNVSEWNHEVYGDYNYFTNKDQIDRYWEGRLKEVSDTENKTIMTLGMRGIHDSHMQGAESIEDNVLMLENIIDKQRDMLSETMKTPLSEIPQVLVPYKEVLELYNSGLKIPDDVTLMWTDDNYGYIRRLSNKKEQERAGGSGVYYHLSYWGRPHDYLWLSTTQPGLIWYEMSKAYQNGAQKIWIANVGDIKPSEYNMEFFLDLAWDIDMVKPDEIHQHLKDWASREFGDKVADEVTELMDEYYRLAFLRKPEFMGWGQTERTTPNRISDLTTEEVEQRILAYAELIKKADRLKEFIPKERLSAWFQLVEYPVKGAGYMNHKFMYLQLAAETSDLEKQKEYLQLSKDSYANIVELTKYYNTEMSNGKWKYMMSMSPRNLPVFDAPTSADLQNEKTGNTTNYNEVFHINANEFVESNGSQEYSWQTINGLGYSNNSITLFPLKAKKFKENQPWVSYTFNTKDTGVYEVEIRLLPTHANDFDHEIGVQIDGVEIEIVSINTKGRSKEWKENVLRNSAVVKIPFPIDTVGKHTLKIFVNQTGIVIDALSVNHLK